MRYLTFHASFFPIHKNDNNYTCHLCTSKERGRTNEMSVKGFELFRIKLLWLHKVQSSIPRLYFSWHLPPPLKFFARHWLLLLPTSLPPSLLGDCQNFSREMPGCCCFLLKTRETLWSWPWYLQLLFLWPVSLRMWGCFAGREGGSMTWESMWETSAQHSPRTR